MMGNIFEVSVQARHYLSPGGRHTACGIELDRVPVLDTDDFAPDWITRYFERVTCRECHAIMSELQHPERTSTSWPPYEVSLPAHPPSNPPVEPPLTIQREDSENKDPKQRAYAWAEDIRTRAMTDEQATQLALVYTHLALLDTLEAIKAVLERIEGRIK